MDEVSQFLLDVGRHLFDMDGLLRVLSRPEFVVLTGAVIALIVFVETGLLVGFCLPGDSLLVTAGLVWYQLVNVHGVPAWSLAALLVAVCLAAVVGDTVGYWIGYKTGPKIFCRENSLLFHKDHLLKAQAFYERHGGKTIILARFVPIIRTFAPVVAGVGRMHYPRFLSYNIFGGVGWVCSTILLGYALTPVLDPALKPILGDAFRVQDHIEKVIVVVVFLSISPGIWHWLSGKLKGAPKPVAQPVSAEAK
jgi:membrane-associated protein